MLAFVPLTLGGTHPLRVAWDLIKPDLIRVAVAFGTESGVEELRGKIIGRTAFDAVDKEWLIGIQEGLTQPYALRRLQSLNASALRVPFGSAALASRTLQAPTFFHPKVYYLENRSTGQVQVLSASANLSYRGLSASVEQFLAWSGVRKDPESRAFTKWWTDLWQKADIPDATFINKYEQLRPSLPTPPKAITRGPRASVLRKAEAFWVELTRRPEGGSFNQVELLFNGHYFFHPGTALPRPDAGRSLSFVDTAGTVYDNPHRQIMFNGPPRKPGGNQMWRIYMPTANEGFVGYQDGDVLVRFERTRTRDRYRVEIASLARREGRSMDPIVDWHLQARRPCPSPHGLVVSGSKSRLARIAEPPSSVRAMQVPGIVERLARARRVTEADIQSDVRGLLLYGDLDLDEKDLIVMEAPVGAGRRIDVEIGATAIEVKKSLDNDAAHAKAANQLGGYIQSRTTDTGHRYAGILTDGRLWELYHLTSDGPTLVNTMRLRGEPGDTEALTVWLEGVLATAQDISPSPVEIHRRLGAKSSSFALDYADLRAVYAQHKGDTDVALKRELWSRLLASALGTHFPDTDELFVLHTYLVVSAELIAHTAVDLPVVGQSPRALLTGEVFRAARLGGVVEPDFFDWPADSEIGRRFVYSLARRIARFDWSHVDHDVLKALYESVIDAETRKQLGEYYTPDWLAEGMVVRTVSDPLSQRVLDPACGSGTFLFWAVKRYLEAAEASGATNEEALTGLVAHVAGIDLHPVAVALARVTYLLAIGTERLQTQRPAFTVPVYLGDSVRWEQDETLLAKEGITIYTTDGAELFDRELHFPSVLSPTRAGSISSWPNSRIAPRVAAAVPPFLASMPSSTGWRFTRMTETT